MKVRLSKKIGLAAISAFALALLFGGALSGGRNAAAATYTCRNNSTCLNSSTCTGDYYTLSGCVVQCYREAGTNSPGQLVTSGSANCASTTGGGGGGGATAFYYGEGDTSYCAENWMWDSACSGPDDAYAPTYKSF